MIYGEINKIKECFKGKFEMSQKLVNMINLEGFEHIFEMDQSADNWIELEDFEDILFEISQRV